MSFTKADFADPSLSENQDLITSNVALTRGSGGGVFNALAESSFPIQDPSAQSPLFTRWATAINNPDLPPGVTIAAEHWESLVFDTWLNAYGGLGQAGPATVGKDAVMHIDREDLGLPDIYLDIRFTDWTGSAGGFTYLRSATPTGDYNGNGKVDAADYIVWRKTRNQPAVPAGSGADGDADGTIGPGDYEFWRARFGNTVPGAGSGAGATTVPEPTSAILLLTVLLAFHRRSR